MTTFKKSLLREYFESIVVAVILALFIRTWVVQAFKIPTGSMEQSLLVGDHLLVNKFVLGPTVSEVERILLPMTSVRRGDVVVFKYPEDPERDFIKRVIGLPGETIEIRQNKVLIDGRLIEEPYLSAQLNSSFVGRDEYGPMIIPDDEYFVMGDNRGNSQDSRYWGTLPRVYLKGKALLVYWSYDSRAGMYENGGSSGGTQGFLSVLTNFFTQTRWERSLSQIR